MLLRQLIIDVVDVDYVAEMVRKVVRWARVACDTVIGGESILSE